MRSSFISLIANPQSDRSELRVALAEALEVGMERAEAVELVWVHALASLGRALYLANRPEEGIECLLQAIDSPNGAHSFLDLLIRKAEACMALGEFREAICCWQDIAVLLGVKTPEYVYYELSFAYAQNREGFGGSADENRCWGDCHKHDILSLLHQALRPQLYLEIGVDEGAGLARALGPAIGIDPRPDLHLTFQLRADSQIFPMSSDAFFRDKATSLLQPLPDLVFIDGMHLFEFALRDFMNVERNASPYSLVVIDDIFPCHPVQAARRRRSGAWTGDVWKLHQILLEYRPDLTLLALNAETTGLLLIAGLNPGNSVLDVHYHELVRRFRPITVVPETVLARYGTIPSGHPVLIEFLRSLKTARHEQWSVNDLQVALYRLGIDIALVADEYRGLAAESIGVCSLDRVYSGLSGL